MITFSKHTIPGNAVTAIFIILCSISAASALHARPAIHSIANTGEAIKIYGFHSHTVSTLKSNMAAPLVQSVSPAQNALHVARTTTVQVTFDQAMLPGSFDDETSFIVSGMVSGRHTGTFDFTGGNTVATFTPTEPFAYGETVVVRLTSSLQSSGSEALTPFVYTFTTETGFSSGIFAPKTDYGTETNPNSVFVSDLDGDGDGDLAVVNQGSNTVSILKNNGNGTFATKTDYTTGTGPGSVFVSDLDGDGDGDLAVTNLSSNNVSILKNNGNGTFATKDDYAAGTAPGSVFVSDLDGDGDGDLAVANSDNSDDISILKNKGDGTFAAKVGYGTGDLPRSVFVSDLDGDGDGDLAVANQISNNVSILKNNGDGTFAAKTDYPTGTGPNSVFVSDLDEDGDGDLAVANPSSDNVSILKNNGNGTFAAKTDYAGTGPGSVFVSDLDGDGDGDLALTNFSSDNVSILKNNGNGTFAAKTDYAVGDAPVSVFVSDLDGDGDGDLAVVNRFSGNVSILKNIVVDEAFDQSLAFDGAGDYLNISSVAGEITGVTDMSIEFWMKGDQDEQGGNQSALIAVNTSSGGNRLILLMGEGGNQDGFTHLYDGASAAYVTDGTIPIGDNRWHHIAMVQNTADDSIYTYVDGLQDASFGTTGADFLTTDQWSFGQEFDGSGGGTPGDYLNGHVDDIRIWTKALSLQEIRNNMFQAFNGDEAGLAGYWPLRETAGSIAFDLSTNDNHGTLINDPAWNTEGHPYGTFITGAEGWRMMTSPVGGASYGTLLDTLWTQGFTGADVSGGTSNVYRWNEAGQQFESIANATDVPTAGTGFITYVYADDDPDAGGVQGGFPKMIKVDSSQTDSTVRPTLSYTNDGVPDSVGWNLVGNPYGATIDWDAASGWTKTNLESSFYVWSDSANGGIGSYLSWNGSEGTLPNGLIAPWQGFWVQANAASPALEMTDSVRNGGGVFLKQRPVPQIRFKLAQRQEGSAPTTVGIDLQSAAVLMFDERAEPGKDRFDAWKLQSLNQQYLSLYTTATGGEALDINALPIEIEHPLELTLNFEGSNLCGEYMLRWNPKNLPDSWTQGSVTLTDLHTGRVIALDQRGEYSFDVTASNSQSKSLSPGERGWGEGPTHGPTPTVLRAKVINPRFLLKINPNGTNNPLAGIPESNELNQNYPNPFNPETIIRYGVPQQSTVQLTVFDILGRKVATLMNEEKSPGRYQVNFNASRFASGLYLYRLKVGSNVLTKKMMLIK